MTDTNNIQKYGENKYKIKERTYSYRTIKNESWSSIVLLDNAIKHLEYTVCDIENEENGLTEEEIHDNRFLVPKSAIIGIDRMWHNVEKLY